MATGGHTDDELLKDERKQNLQERLKAMGLAAEYWLPKLQEHLGVTCAQALQRFNEDDLQNLKSQARHPWETRALEKLLSLSQSGLSGSKQSLLELMNQKQMQAKQALQELKNLLSEGRKQHEEAVKRKKEELRQAMEIPEEYWPPLEMPLWEVLDNMQRQLRLSEETITPRQNLPDQDLLRRASGGLALQGIYKTSQQRDLLERRGELLTVPKELSLLGPEQGTRMETVEFTSHEAESMFTQRIEKLGFSLSKSAEVVDWEVSLEAGMDNSESREKEQSHSGNSYFCSVKFSYVPLASCHFSMDQLQLSKAALQELKCIEDLLDQTTSSDKLHTMRHRMENFFHRFGSHANQGPLHLGGIFWWRAISEGFQTEQLKDVKGQSAKALDIYIRSSYGGFEVNVLEGRKVSNTHSKADILTEAFQTLQTKVQLSMNQTGGPPEADGFMQWKAGLIANNQTWCIIDRGQQLVPIWDIILFNHKHDFKNALQMAQYLNDTYATITSLNVQIQLEEELPSTEKEVRDLLKDVKSWKVSEPEEQLQKLIDFMQMLNQKTKNYDTWINICLTSGDLQHFLVRAVEFCKQASTYRTKLIKSQLQSLLDPHIYKVTNFPEAHSIMQWMFQSETYPEPQQANVSQFSELTDILRKNYNELMDLKVNSEFQDSIEAARRKANFEISSTLSSFLNYLQKTGQTDTYLLFLSIAVGAGYQVVNNTFQCLGENEINLLLNEVLTVNHTYLKLKSISTYRAQAFLILTGLTATVGITAVSPEDKRRRLQLMKQHMGQPWSKEVAYVLSKPRTDHDWDTLEKDLRLLIDGDNEATNSSLQMDKVENQLESLFHGKKQSQKTHENENSERKAVDSGPFPDLLQQLGLEHYYPKRMGRADFHIIYKNSVYNTQPSSEKEISHFFLQKLLMLDYSLRHLAVRDDRDTKYHVDLIASDQKNEIFDPYEDFIEDEPSSPKPSSTKPSQLNKPHIHPMDIQMAIFHCADDFARQYILGKLAICQFALPLVVPNPCSSQIEFSLWSLRQIRKSWQPGSKSSGGKNRYRNQQICSVSTPIVSFIRVGNGLSASKSQTMNHILSKHKHDVFFHRNCRGSTKRCLLMEGVVEVSWFCPGGDDEDRFDNCVTFTNLHGDAKEHKRQLTFLQEISSLIVVLMSVSDNNEENRKIVRGLSQSPKPLLFLLDDKEQGMSNHSGHRVRIGIRNRNKAELTEEIAIAIKHLLESSDTSLSLEDCSLIARQQGFLIDEDQRECKEAKEKAQNVMALLSETGLSHVKENFLPLQGTLWHLWCQKDRELYHLTEKGNRSIEQHKSDTQREKQVIRQEQLIKAFPLNDLMRSVLDNLQGNSETHTKHYFLPWLNVFLDNLTAGCVEQSHGKQRPLLPQIKEKKKNKLKKNYLQDQQSKMGDISTENHNCILGVEQLFREVGQIYEALKETSSKIIPLFHSLPEIAADLMIAGVPIELMDGDASYVPLTWVAGVFDKLAEKLGDKKLFVLSTIGLQSSGKSTLLNALFGLQFTVSAGRCTRGACMQLLKVEETFTGELGFDFVLVVDTQGLRAPELSNKSQNRDNELATFVIGLGNLTLINIFGENPSEMQDILQIVVQVLLRMKQVKISPSCIFVHQNVEEVTAEHQLMQARRKLEQRLDGMAKLAAEQEQFSDITCFNDVIKFDINTHVYYFAYLWDGNPPMAPPNPRYSLNVQELRSKILMSAKEKSKEGFMKISDLKSRIQDLWKALVSENFIFSFKNTLEVVAMSKLETMYNQCTWELKSHVLDLQNQLTNQIKNGKIQTLSISTIEAPVTEKYEAIKKEFEKFLTEDPDNEILIQWKANFEHKLFMLKDTLISESLRKTDELIHFKKSQENLDIKKAKYERELLEKSRKLALSIKDKELSKEEVQKIFHQLWTKWVHDVSTFPQVEEPDIELDAENILLNYFKSETNIMETLGKKSGKIFQMDYTEHVKMSTKYYISRNHLEAQDKEDINRTSKHIFIRFEETIKDICLQQRDYSSSDFHKILRIIEEEVKSAPTAKKYSFTNKYKIDMSLHLFQIASQYFKEMHEAFKRANDPVYYLESKKGDFFMSFEISIQGATSIKTFVDFLWNKLSPAVSKTIRQKAVPKIAGDMRNTCPEFNGNRANLEKHILISLAEEENFEKYWQYICEPKSFFRSYIETQIRKYCSGSGAETIQAFLKLSLDDIKNVLLSAIHKSTAEAKDKSSTASEWLDLFCDHLGSNLIFPRSDLISIEHQEIKDMEFLKEAMSADLDPAMKTIEQNCLSIPVEEFIPAIEKILYEHLCGCWKQCPFCKAICTNTIPEHDGDHSVPFHRPQAVSGWHWTTTDNLTIDYCTSLVASDCSFLLNEDEKIPYKNYRQAGGNYATWSITPDSSIQPYWKWFVSHFRANLEEKYQKRFAGKGQIPDEWARITKQEVLEVLKTQ